MQNIMIYCGKLFADGHGSYFKWSEKYFEFCFHILINKYFCFKLIVRYTEDNYIGSTSTLS